MTLYDSINFPLRRLNNVDTGIVNLGGQAPQKTLSLLRPQYIPRGGATDAMRFTSLERHLHYFIAARSLAAEQAAGYTLSHRAQ